MCSLQNFPAPELGRITVAEVDGQIITVPDTDVDHINYFPQIDSYPQILIQDSLVKTTAPKNGVKSAFIPYEEMTLKKAVHAWYESGWKAALEEVAGSRQSGLLGKFSHAVLQVIRWWTSMLSSEEITSMFSSTREWQTSTIRRLAWHPHTIKLAVALLDDSIHVYCNSLPVNPTLKYKCQKGVADMAWKPYSASVLAVACQSFILIWQVDPMSLITRPSGNSVTVLTHPGHAPVTSLSWNRSGNLLISSSPVDKTMLVWDPACEICVPLYRVGGGGVSLVNWSPDGSRVIAATPSTIFRVWNTNGWTHERWTTVSGHIHVACWSPDGSILLFATSDEPFVYSLSFSSVKGDGAQSAIPAIDLSEVMKGDVGEEVRVGGCVQHMVWDPRGERLAISFRDNELIAIFRTWTKQTLQISPCGFIMLPSMDIPMCMSFQKNFDSGALLTVATSSGHIKYYPLLFLPTREIQTNGNVSMRDMSTLWMTNASQLYASFEIQS